MSGRPSGSWLAKLAASRGFRGLFILATVAGAVALFAPDIALVRPISQPPPEPSAPEPVAGFPEVGVLDRMAPLEHAKPETVASLDREALAPPDLPLGMLDGDGPTSADQLEVEAGDLDSHFDCVIEPFEIVAVGSALAAVIKTVHVRRSDFVEKGQVLAELEDEVERAAVEVARMRSEMTGDVRARQASLALGEGRRRRASQLFKEEVVSADLREEAETEAALAEAELQQARESQSLMALRLEEARQRLARRTIRSPISGVVVERLKSPGEIVKEETILTIAQIDPLRVEAVLPGALFGSLEVGMHAEVRPELPDLGIQIATVEIVDRVIDARSGTFGVRLLLPNADRAIPSGLHCQVHFLPPE